MFSVRKTTKFHGTTSFYILVFILIVTTLLIYEYGRNYLAIYLSSGLLHAVIESGLTVSGIRKGETFLFGKKLSKLSEIFLRSFMEGPAFCVPAFFLADQYRMGNLMYASFLTIVVVGGASFLLGWSDKKNIAKVVSENSIIIVRRAMMNPKASMLLALLNTICISMIFLIPSAAREHAFTYVFSYALLVLFFYFINYNLGVRYIEQFDPIKNEYLRPGVLMQAAGLTYDSAYEMTLLISPAYWVPFYFGLFN